MIRALMIEEPNPIGEVHEVPEVEEHLVALAEAWDAQKEAEGGSVWYKPWTWFRKSNLVKVTNFLLMSLDELIGMVDDVIDTGPDKKATVLNAISRLYDYVIKEAMPIWLKPFAGRVKDYIIFTLISSAIDWIVDKYRNGSWRDKIQPQD
jgi:hypothetical protein